jgi:SAM-dependent methyltransferase
MVTHLRRDGWIREGCRMLDLGSQDFDIRSAEEFAGLKEDMEEFARRPLPLTQDEYIGKIPARRVFSEIGIDYDCVDIDGCNNSIYMDLNFREMIPRLFNSFDFISNQGTSEHLVNQGNCFANIHDMLKPGGIFHSNVPILGLQSHGQVNLTLEFWKNLVAVNNYTTISMLIDAPLELPSIPVIPYGMEKVGNVELMSPLNSCFHIMLKKNGDEPFIFPIDAINPAVEPIWSRRLMRSAMVASYVATKMMSEADVAGALDRAMERLFPHHAGRSVAPPPPKPPAQPTPRGAGADTDEGVAYKLFRHIADVERGGRGEPQLDADNAEADQNWGLETFAECVATLRNPRPRRSLQMATLSGTEEYPDMRSHTVGLDGLGTSDLQQPKGVQLDFCSSPVTEVVEKFLRNGSVLLHNFAENSALLRMKKDIDQLYRQIKDVHVHDHQMTERGFRDISDYIFTDKHRQLADCLFGKLQYRTQALARRTHPVGLSDEFGGAWQRPLSPRIDAFYHPMTFSVTLWVPLQECGRGTPRLGVVCTPFADVLDFVGYRDAGRVSLPAPEFNLARFNPLSRKLFEGNAAAVDTFRARYADRLWTPNYKLGDAMLLSNWTLHFTDAQPSMYRRCEDIEIRLMGQETLEQTLQRHENSGTSKKQGIADDVA